MAITVTPILAPVLGGYLTVLGWQLNFMFLLFYGSLAWLIIFIFLPETKSTVNKS